MTDGHARFKRTSSERDCRRYVADIQRLERPVRRWTTTPGVCDVSFVANQNDIDYVGQCKGELIRLLPQCSKAFIVELLAEIGVQEVGPAQPNPTGRGRPYYLIPTEEILKWSWHVAKE
jgi:hypothetical protein